MPTTHIFIVNEDTFPIHLKYLFAGTGAGNKTTHIGLSADIRRVRNNDFVIFYLERVGFFGLYKIDGEPFKDTSNPTYLENELNKKLIYRVRIKPYKVYPNFISEWDALDKLPLYAQDVIWSLIYRKLKGQRGCTPITPQESNRLIEMLDNTNKGTYLEIYPNMHLSYNRNLKKIEQKETTFEYKGITSPFEDILNEMILLDKMKRAFEDRLQAYFTQFIGKINKLNEISGIKDEIIWIGNEVACGVGMQKIDIFTITTDQRENKLFNLIELKCQTAKPEIIYQLQRYVEWTSSYIKGAINSNIQPILITKKIEAKSKKKVMKDNSFRDETIKSLINFNKLNISRKVKWIEYYFTDKDIVFEKIDYESCKSL